MSESNIPVLIVDDNPSYREAFCRNLELMDFDVSSAEDGDEAIRELQQKGPMVLVTDLQMRSDTEGLELIRRARDLYPLLPVIMISAVGSFEEGALATQYGAAHVIHKSHIDSELDPLYEKITSTYQAFQQNYALLKKIRKISENNDPEAVMQLQDILMRPDTDSLVKSEAYEALINLQGAQMLSAAEKQVTDLATDEEGALSIENIRSEIKERLPFYDSLDQVTKDTLNSAEFLFFQQEKDKDNFDFSRNIGFSYCFAVENEVKLFLKRKLSRFLNNDKSFKLIKSLMDRNQKSLDLFYHQYLLQSIHTLDLAITSENVKQTFARMLQHQSRYKPDGLKAVGIIIFCFGREYQFQRGNRTVEVRNPLNLKLDEQEDETIEDLAANLIKLQHYRNPYIHPEVSDLHKIPKVRESAMKCLRMINKIV